MTMEWKQKHSVSSLDGTFCKTAPPLLRPLPISAVTVEACAAVTFASMEAPRETAERAHSLLPTLALCFRTEIGGLSSASFSSYLGGLEHDVDALGSTWQDTTRKG